MQLSRHLYFMELAETTEAKAITMEEKVANAEQELGEAKIRATEAKREFSEEKKWANGLSKNIIHLAMKLGEAGGHLAFMHPKLEAACAGKA